MSADTVWIPAVPLPFEGWRTDRCSCGKRFRGKDRRAAYEIHYRREHDLPGRQVLMEVTRAEADRVNAIVRADQREWVERVRARESPWDDDRFYRDFITSGLTLAHQGHDGIPGAPDDVWCARCEADRALDSLIAAVPAGRPLGPQECVVVLHHREADALLALLEAALNKQIDPGVGLRREDAEAAGVKIELARQGITP